MAAPHSLVFAGTNGESNGSWTSDSLVFAGTDGEQVNADSSGPYSDDYLTLDADQLSVQQSITLTDGDGDTTNATAAFDLGGNFQIGDDGPALHHR